MKGYQAKSSWLWRTQIDAAMISTYEVLFVTKPWILLWLKPSDDFLVVTVLDFGCEVGLWNGGGDKSYALVVMLSSGNPWDAIRFEGPATRGDAILMLPRWNPPGSWLWHPCLPSLFWWFPREFGECGWWRPKPGLRHRVIGRNKLSSCLRRIKGPTRQPCYMVVVCILRTEVKIVKCDPKIMVVAEKFDFTRLSRECLELAKAGSTWKTRSQHGCDVSCLRRCGNLYRIERFPGSPWHEVACHRSYRR